MVLIQAQSKYGAVNDYKKNTFGFTRVLRSIFSVFDNLSKDLDCSPETAMALIREQLTLEPFVRVDEPIKVDMRHENASLNHFLSHSSLGKRVYIFQVIELLLRLPTRDGYEALGMFELASFKARRLYGGLPTPRPIERPIAEQPVIETPKVDPTPVERPVVEPAPRKTFKTKKPEQPTPAQPKPVKTNEQPKTPPVSDKLDEIIKRGKEALAKSEETLAESGQVVTTNPLLADFL